MEAPGFWDNPDRSNKLMKELKNLKDPVRPTRIYGPVMMTF